MNVTGIVAEYNPFHNGHLYHLEQARRVTGSDAIICVMSGNFVQRGEPAIVNKWARARMAIAAGADIVIELPVTFSLQSAEGFARGAIGLLDATGIVNNLVFGSETGEIEPLYSIAGFLYNESRQYKESLKKELKKGITFPLARMNAVSMYEGMKKYAHVLKNPNNILGIEYIKSLMVLDSQIRPFTIKRIESSYNYPHLKKIPSATAVRNHIRLHKKLTKTLDFCLPLFSIELLEKEFMEGLGPVFLEDFNQIILGILRLKPAQDLADLAGASEGLQNRILEEARKCGDVKELIFRVKTKRYTLTRLQRLLWQSILGLTKKLTESEPQYIRVLGFSEGYGRVLLKLMKKTSKLPVIIKPAHYKNLNENAVTLIKKDFLATDIYSLAYKKPTARRAGWDLVTSVYIGCKEPCLR